MDAMGGLFAVLVIWARIAIPIVKATQASRLKRNGSPKADPNRQGAAQNTAPAAPAQGLQAIQSTLAPSVDYGSHDDSLYQGSMNAISTEGYDPCHEEELNGLNAAKATPVLQPANSEPAALPFGWTGSDMVKGIVISEILKRRA